MTDLTHNPADQTSKRFKLLADEKRRRIIGLLIGKKCTVNEISKSLDIERSLTSHNLKMLREEGLLQCEKEGREVVYFVPESLVSDKAAPILELGCCQIHFK